MSEIPIQPVRIKLHDLLRGLGWTAPEWRGEVEIEEGPCTDCEWTPSGYFAYPCALHGCAACGHLKHDAEDGCGHPDPVTGWCECQIDIEGPS